MWRRTGRGEQAAEALREASQIGERLTARFPGEPRYQESLARTYAHRAEVSFDHKEFAAASQLLDKRIALLETLTAGDRPDPFLRSELGGAYNLRAQILLEAGDLVAAQQSIDRSLQLRKEVAAGFPDLVSVQQALSFTYTTMGRVMAAQARPNEACDAYRKALLHAQALLKAFPGSHARQETAIIHAGLAWLYAGGPPSLRDPDRALHHIHIALELGPARQRYLTAILGLVYYRRGEWKQAIRVLSNFEPNGDPPGTSAALWTTDAMPLRTCADDGEGMARPLSLLVVAMSHWKLGANELARSCYQRAHQLFPAIRFKSRHSSKALETIQAEATKLLKEPRLANDKVTSRTTISAAGVGTFRIAATSIAERSRGAYTVTIASFSDRNGK